MRYISLIFLISAIPFATLAEGPADYQEANPVLAAKEQAGHVCLRALEAFTQGVLLFISHGGDQATVVRENSRANIDGMPEAKYTLALIEPIFKGDQEAYKKAAVAFTDHCTEVITPRFLE